MILKIAGPFGQRGRCLAWSLFRHGQSYGAVSVQVRLITVVLQGLLLVHFMIQCVIVICILRNLSYFHNKNINFNYTSTVPKH